MDYGTKKVRYGQDSQIPFGHCCLSLTRVKEDPVFTPSGHLYAKSAICAYMLKKIKDLKEQKRKYEAEVERIKSEEERKALKDDAKAKETFLMIQDLPTQAGAAKEGEGVGATSEKKRKEANERKRKRAIEVLTSKNDTETQEMKRRGLKRASFWLPSSAPAEVRKTLKRPPKRPQSPMTGAPLRMKHLIPATLTTDPDDGSFICPVSKKKITTQQCVLIKPTGHVLLESVFEKIRDEKNLTCPVTSEQIESDEVIRIARAGSSFAASGDVEAEKWRPAI